ncbi:ImmA/IrrE family metallo-endopeptidase [Listeria aquatica]|uniref:ImmA/IrrE family metallo-endopeptidase n=1 Tax=Listeria aquatica TaxID=1494960 RepID=A0A841ZMA8_9LIST|nr:ImmA/IrrE family metallo-endopeptidase [Listeria aquatica]MBC1521436.1 ImmA/IrrE family metallo-endopeptidase [Listeria aquatica]
MDFDKIARDTENLIQRHGTSDPFQLASNCGYMIREIDLGENNYGIRVSTKRIQTILINGNKDEIIRNFVCSHEFQHCRHHRDESTPFLRKHLNGLFVPRIEKEANFGAFYLLSYNLDKSDFKNYTKEQLLSILGLPDELACFLDEDILNTYIL